MASSLEERHGRTRILAGIDAAVVFKIFVRRRSRLRFRQRPSPKLSTETSYADYPILETAVLSVQEAAITGLAVA
jgi:hypothetical protein